MSCYRPVRAYQKADGEVVFSEVRGDYIRTLELPCGQCIGCRLERSRQWAVRCLHESKLHEENSFVTLTYSDENLPSNGSLVYKHFQLFMRRMRKSLGAPVRFYMAGEYGEQYGRPHYHALLFGKDFSDKKYFKSGKFGDALFTSRELDSYWRLGQCLVGTVTIQSAGYIARYCMKKVTGQFAEQYYGDRVPEFNRMSLKPGIGAGWFEKYYLNWYPVGRVVVDGRAQGPPRYYDVLFGRIDPDALEQLRYERSVLARSRSWDNTDARLRVREQVVQGRYKFMEEQ